ncbi:unnamed protein product, partial [Amoebophrya sp. A120]
VIQDEVLLQDVYQAERPNQLSYTSIVVHKNAKTEIHTDRGNVGLSEICCCGDYEGGG